MKHLLPLILLLGIISCESPKQETRTSQPSVLPKNRRPISLDNGKFLDIAGKKMMYGGEDSTTHFDISNLELEKGQFHYGIGREAFPALIAPSFISMKEADSIWSDSTRFLVGTVNGETKAYSVPDLTHHEVVNDILGGQPVMAAYCILADLGAFYERTYGDQVFTFGLTGYTYFDPEVWDGLDGFMLWDRETESMWWPLIGKAVSGPLKGVKLLEMDESQWEDIPWVEVKSKYKNVKVLKSGQDFKRPDSWNRVEDVSAIVTNFSL